ncbi:outer membrane protein assembly factor BamE [Oxalobacteraceae bacterium R-40]|uniref:Outer membrane protein assembly factor BamE n=1 Tax=Keguizhuia sedimenti TaxID=3064264 RepID=A0ABU1BM25_9BURK|nr:outer membrane protein assembly factor BamE [Oxalobacteraceae bacterium R-40]
MRLASFHFGRLRGLTSGMLFLAVMGGLTACASKNPLIDEPAASAKPAPATASSNAESAPSTQNANTSTPTTSAGGVQTVKEKRFLGFLSPYRPDIQQGNFVSQEMVAQLKEGMTREQVIFVLGTPLLNDIFHADRWDYAFRYKKGNGEITNSRVTVFFKDNRLVRYEGGNLPTEEDYLARIAGTPKKTSSAQPSTPQQAAPSSAGGPQN